jgi:pimeloyl-ACP methyl ester carboxylesterase
VRIGLAEWRGRGRELNYRGHRIFVRSDGDAAAEALLLVHGFPTASWDWEALWPELARRYRVYALDLIGFGFSAKPRDYDYSILDQAQLCEDWLRAEGVHDYHLLAHDYGDSVAQELLARQRDGSGGPKLHSVAFLNGGLFPEMHRPVLLQKLLLTPFGPLIARFTNRAALAKNMRRIFGPDTPPEAEVIDAFWSLLQHGDGRAVMPRLIRYIPERRQQRARWVGALQGARVPLKLIVGEADPISGAHMAERYRELVPNADITALPRIGHYPQVEAPQAVLAAYRAFRDGIRSAP